MIIGGAGNSVDTDRVDSGGDEFILVNAIVEQGGRPLYGSLSGVIMYASMYISKATRFKTADAPSVRATDTPEAHINGWWVRLIRTAGIIWYDDEQRQGECDTGAGEHGRGRYYGRIRGDQRV